MIKNISISFIIMFVFAILFSFRNQHSETDIVYLDKIYNENEYIEDSILLRRKFKALEIGKDQITKSHLQVIYLSLLANLHSKKVDGKNSKSEQLFKEAIRISYSTNHQDLILFSNTYLGFYYYSYSDVVNALPYFITSSKILDAKSTSSQFRFADILKKNAYFFITVEEDEKSLNYLKTALKHTSTNYPEYSNLLSGIAQYYIKHKNYEEAKKYIIKTILYSKKNNRIRYAKALGDLALIHKNEKSYKTAIKLLEEDIEISKAINENRNTIYATILLGEIYLETDSIHKAKELIVQAKNYADDKEHLKGFLYQINEILLKIAILQNNDADELNYRRKLSLLKNELSHTDGADVINKVNWEIQKQNITYKLEVENAKIEKEKIITKALIIILILLIISLLFVYLYFIKRLKDKKIFYNNIVRKLQSQKLQSEEKLGEKTSSLNAYKTYLVEKNILIDNLKKEIEHIQNSKISYLEDKNGELQRLLESHLMTEENWIAFKETFRNEQTEYYNYIITTYPNLTDSNLRLIFLHKMGLSNTQISQILGVTVEAVKKAKQRLRKKYPENSHLIMSKENQKKPTE